MTFRRLLIALVALLAFGITLRAGFWQLDRAQQKVAAQSRQAEQARRGALGNAELLQALPTLAEAARVAPPQADHFIARTVRLQGHWLGEHTLYLDNRSMDGRAGFVVLTPLALAPTRTEAAELATSSGIPPWVARATVVWVQRGWAPRHAVDRTQLPPVATPSGTVQLTGRLAAEPSRRYALGEDGVGAIRQNLAAPQMQALVQQPVLSMVVVQTDAPSDGLLRHWPPPAFGADKNRGYAVQWFAMAALIWVLYVWFQLIRPIRHRRRI